MATPEKRKTAYDRLELTAPKGYKGKIKGYAESCQQSINGFIMAAVAEKIERCNDGAAAVRAGIISPVTLETAERAAESTGESVREFIARAVDTQEEQDALTLDRGYDPTTGKQE